MSGGGDIDINMKDSLYCTCAIYCTSTAQQIDIQTINKYVLCCGMRI